MYQIEINCADTTVFMFTFNLQISAQTLETELLNSFGYLCQTLLISHHNISIIYLILSHSPYLS